MEIVELVGTLLLTMLITRKSEREMSKKKVTNKKTKSKGPGPGRPKLFETKGKMLVVLDGDILSKIDDIAASNYRTRSSQVRLIIDAYFESNG